MANETVSIAHTSTFTNLLLWIGRALLLVPEAALIPALLCVYSVFGKPIMIGFLVALLVASFIARTIALHLGRAALEGACYREAELLIRVASTLHPWSADTMALRGAWALATGAPEIAEAALQRAIALLPGQSAFHAAMSSILLERGRPVEAAASAHAALALDSRSSMAYLYLAEAERATGAAAQNVEDLLRTGLAMARGVTHQAVLQCALVSHLLSEHRIAEATLVLHSAETLLPRCSILRQAELHFHLGELLIAQGQIERAREYFRGVERLDPHGRYAAATRGQ